MTRKNRWKWLLTATALAVGLALIASACGGGKKSSSSSGGGSTTSTGGKTFANFRIAYDTGIDFLDPSLSYTVQGWAIMWNVYLPLLGYKHVNGPDGATIVPYLAQSLPTVSSDGKTYTLTLRKGVKYSNGAPVKASDFAYAIERDFQIDSPGVGFFGNIVGANAYGTTKKGHIGGIVTNDATGKITIHLTAPEGDFENILATTFTALVPAGTPNKDQSTTPIPSTGPYMIQSYSPNKQVIVVRNPHFDASLYGGNVPAGNPDKMTIQIFGDASVALTRTLNGQDDYDFYQPPNDRLGQLESKYANQIKVYTPANTFYFFMNTRVAPFNNLKVRQAVNYAINRQALVRIYGGLATPTENVLPPTYPQYREAQPLPVQPGEGEATDRAGRSEGRGGDDLGQQQREPSLTGGDRLPPAGAEVDRPQREAEDHQRRRLLDHDRQPGDEGADRLRGLVPGLSASARLVRRAAERRPDHGRRTTTTTPTSTTRRSMPRSPR